MGARCLIVWREDVGAWFLLYEDEKQGPYSTAEAAIDAAFEEFDTVAVDEHMPPEILIQVTAAAIFKRVRLYNKKGEVFTPTPVPDALPRYLTRQELGPILPEGWMIEVQLNRYAACWGEEMTFPARPRLMLAIADIRAFLAASALQASQELASSLSAELSQDEMVQRPMWLSTDSPAGAVDEVHRS
jgi:hypothetical protein